MKILRCLFFCLILVCSCSINEYQLNKPIQEIKAIKTIPINYQAKKAVYSSRYQTLFVLNEQFNEIWIYRNEELVNKIGSSGFSDNNFKKLSDLCLSNDNSLLALDSFDKKIKKFDQNGQLLSSVSLSQVRDPILLDMNESGSLFIYDDSFKEIFVFDNTNLKFLFSFAKFQFQKLDNLNVNNENVLAFDQINNKTSIFDINGRLIDEHNNQIFYDRGLNKISLTNNLLQTENNKNILNNPIFSNDKIIVEDNSIIQISKGFIKIYELIY